MKLVCLECKNDIELREDQAKPEQVVECAMCGITLLITAVDKEVVEAEILDEGK